MPPETPIDVWNPELLPLEKWLPFVAYATLGGALAYAIADWALQNRYQALLVYVTIVVYGIGIEVVPNVHPVPEFLSRPTPTRMFSAQC